MVTRARCYKSYLRHRLQIQNVSILALSLVHVYPYLISGQGLCSAIRDFHIHYSYYFGIYFQDSSSVEISDCLITDSGVGILTLFNGWVLQWSNFESNQRNGSHRKHKNHRTSPESFFNDKIKPGTDVHTAAQSKFSNEVTMALTLLPSFPSRCTNAISSVNRFRLNFALHMDRDGIMCQTNNHSNTIILPSTL